MEITINNALTLLEECLINGSTGQRWLYSWFIAEQDLIEKTVAEAKGLAEEYAYLAWFKQNADFGPADLDVHELLDWRYERETGKKVPEGWKEEEEEEPECANCANCGPEGGPAVGSKFSPCRPCNRLSEWRQRRDETKRECKYPDCFYYKPKAKDYCCNACYSDHQDYKRLS